MHIWSSKPLVNVERIYSRYINDITEKYVTGSQPDTAWNLARSQSLTKTSFAAKSRSWTSCTQTVWHPWRERMWQLDYFAPSLTSLLVNPSDTPNHAAIPVQTPAFFYYYLALAAFPPVKEQTATHALPITCQSPECTGLMWTAALMQSAGAN